MAPPITSSSTDAEGLHGAIKAALRTLKKLAASIDEEERLLVQAGITEADIAASVQKVNVQAVVHAERQLEQRVRRSKHLLEGERKKLRESVGSDSNSRLALAVEQGVNEYYGDVHSTRQEQWECIGARDGAARPGSLLRQLREDERRLDDAVRTLRADINALERDAEAASDQRSSLIDALHQREHEIHASR